MLKRDIIFSYIYKCLTNHQICINPSSLHSETSTQLLISLYELLLPDIFVFIPFNI